MRQLFSPPPLGCGTTGIVYSVLPCIGNIIFQHYTEATICGIAAVVFTGVVAILVKRLLANSSE